MIVKNEVHVLPETLLNLWSHFQIAAYAISDTGSTDGTQEVVRDFFSQRGVPGKVQEDEWKGFGHNRSHAMVLGRNVCREHELDYLLVFDADDRVHGTMQIPCPLTADAYKLKFGGGVSYERPQIFSARKPWRYRGVLHEYADCPEPHRIDTVPGNYWIESGKSGSRSSDPEKYAKDAGVLEEALLTEKDAGMRARYRFYLAQSYKDSGNPRKAVDSYIQTLNEQGWQQEKYMACLHIGDLCKQLGRQGDSIYYYLMSSEHDPDRIEGIVRAAKELRLRGIHRNVAMLYREFKGYPRPDSSKLFVSTHDYDLKLEYEASISCYYTGDKTLGLEACEKCVMANMANSLSNWKFYAPKLRVVSKQSLTRTECLTVDHGNQIVMEDLRSSTPSIISTDDGYRVNIPMHNYSIDGNNYTHGPHTPSYYTTNHCIELSSLLVPQKGSGHTFMEEYNGVRNAGLENLRILSDGRFTANEMQPDGTYHIVIGDYDPSKENLVRTVLPRLQACEKNWVHLCGDEFVHSWHPLKIGEVHGNQFRVTRTIKTPPFFANIRGSTDFSNGYALVHLVSFEDVRFYYHVWVQIDNGVLRYSSPFTFEGQRIEYCTGLIVEPRRMLLTYSTMDVTSHLAVVDRDVVDGMLKYSHKFAATSRSLNDPRADISIVCVTRNDDYGGNQAERMAHFFRHLPRVNEVLVVEWNPQPARPSMADFIRGLGLSYNVRIITVPPEVHTRVGGSKPVKEFIGKNVGIQRARSQFVLCTNPDNIFPEELASELCSIKLDPNTFYRARRADIKDSILFETDDVVSKAKANILCIYGHKLESGLFCACSGDFTMASRTKWMEARGYMETHETHVDSEMLNQFINMGMKQCVLDSCTLHIEHPHPEANDYGLDTMEEIISYLRDIRLSERSQSMGLSNDQLPDTIVDSCSLIKDRDVVEGMLKCRPEREPIDARMNLLVREVRPLVRLGAEKDGGYVIYDGSNIEYDCYISCGVADEESFTRDFQLKFPSVPSFAFDGTIEDYPRQYSSNIAFERKNIGNAETHTTTRLTHIMKKYSNIFLSMDIENWEWQWADTLTIDDLNSFAQIVIELHGFSGNDSWSGTTVSVDKRDSILRKIAKTHYIVHVHANNYPNGLYRDLFEVTYVNKRFFPKEPRPNTVPLPIPGLDFPNGPWPEIDLNYYPFVSPPTDISIVCVTRNDNYGINLAERMGHFFRHLPRVNEVIVVEWNPQPDNPSMADFLRDLKLPYAVRIITVPPEVHARVGTPKPVEEFIGKNVGIRRAKSQFVLCTNVDNIFDPDLATELLSARLDTNTFYRATRKDVHESIALETDNVVEKARSSVVRVNADDGWSKTFGNGSGDFTMAARKKWMEKGGYVEKHETHWHIDSEMLNRFDDMGMKQHVFISCTYHINHEVINHENMYGCNSWEEVDAYLRAFRPGAQRMGLPNEKMPETVVCKCV